MFSRVWDEGPWALDELAPVLDIEEEDDSYLLRAEVPGMSRDDLEVYLEGDNLVIEGERREEKKRRRRSSEIYYGRIYRSLPLPHDARPEGIRTRLRRGVLEVTIPRERKAVKRIEVVEAE